MAQAIKLTSSEKEYHSGVEEKDHILIKDYQDKLFFSENLGSYKQPW